MGELHSIVERIHLFSELSGEQIKRITEESRRLHLPKGNVLFHRGDRADGFYYLINGRVKLSMVSPNGGEKVVEIIRDGMTFGEAVMFIGKPYPVSAQAMNDSYLLFIGREAILQCLDEHREFALKMLMGISRRLHGLIHDIETYSLCSSVQRVVGYLLSELEKQPPGQVKDIHLPASKVVVASRLNLTPETLSRVFFELSKKGLISVNGPDIKVHDVEQFRAYGHDMN